MIQIPYFDKTGKALDPIEVDESLFGGYVRRRLLKEAILMFEANQRVGTHKVKSRAEVAATGAKPWRQKGTGRARSGSAASPIWRGGGVVHGPVPRVYGWTMPKKARRRALDSAILAKLKDGEVVCVEALEFNEPKTRDAARLLGQLGVEGRALIGLDGLNENAYKSFRNLPKVQVDEVRNFHPHGVVGGGVVILTRAALDTLLASRTAQPKNKKPNSEERSDA